MSVVSLPVARRDKASPRKRAWEMTAAAARVFAERGFHGATTQDIADVLGIRQASLYYYFRSKEDALETVCMHGVAGFFEAANAIARGSGSAAERLERLIESHLAPLADRRDFVKVFLNERQFLAAESRRRIGKWSRGVERAFETVIKQGIAAGEFRADINPRLTTLSILGMTNAVSMWFEKEDVELTEIVRDIVRLALDGVRRRAGGRR